MRTKPKVGEIVKSRGEWVEDVAGYIVAKEGIHVWVRFFDTDLEAGSSWDVYTRRDTLEIISRGKN